MQEENAQLCTTSLPHGITLFVLVIAIINNPGMSLAIFALTLKNLQSRRTHTMARQFFSFRFGNE